MKSRLWAKDFKNTAVGQCIFPFFVFYLVTREKSEQKVECSFSFLLDSLLLLSRFLFAAGRIRLPAG